MAETMLPRPYGRRLNLPGTSEVKLEDFSGGLNFRDASSELAANESPDCLNVTLDERGGVVSRLGYTNVFSSVSADHGGAFVDVFFSEELGGKVYAVADEEAGSFFVYESTDLAAWTYLFSLAARPALAEFKGQLLTVDATNGVGRWNGSAWAVIATSPKGKSICVWQNKVFVGDGGATSSPSRVTWCMPGDVDTWDVDDYNDIREKDNEPVVALGVGEGMDSIGRGGMLIFKAESLYRMSDSDTGAFTTLSATIGAPGPLAITTVRGWTVFVSKYGLFRTDGANVPTEVSGRVAPLFDDSQLNIRRFDLVRVGRTPAGRVLASLPLAGNAQNTITLEYDVAQGWIVPHSYAFGAFAQLEGDESKLYGCDRSAKKVYEMFSAGNDDGSPIAFHYQTRWIELAGGIKCRSRRALLSGRGKFTLEVLQDWRRHATDELTRDIEFPESGGIWNENDWNDGTLWGPTAHEDYVPTYSLGVARAIAFRISGLSSTATHGARLLTGIGVASGPRIANALYGILLDYIRLGLA